MRSRIWKPTSHAKLHGVYLTRSQGGEILSISILITVGTNNQGRHVSLDVAESTRADTMNPGEQLSACLKKQQPRDASLMIEK